jgi:signal transduction histidine kinase
MFFAAALAVLIGTTILVRNSMNYALSIVVFDVRDDASMAIIMESMQRNLLTKGGLTVVAVGVVATTAGWLVAGRLLRPLRHITATAQRIAGRTLHRRIALDAAPAEVQSLADSFDRMLDRLDHAFAGQNRFISNAAHELKTPLALNRTLVEVAMMRPGGPPELRQLGATLLAVNARHERLIDALLTLARAEHDAADRVRVDLAEIVTAVTSRSEPFATELGVAVSTELTRVVTLGDPILLEQMVHNLIDNAIRYNTSADHPDGGPPGWVRVSTGPGPAGIELVVANTGATISLYEAPGLFEPFRRLTDRIGSAGGSGLGLSVVRAVAQAHGGDAVAAPRVGGGLTVRVTLPRVELAPYGDGDPARPTPPDAPVR